MTIHVNIGEAKTRFSELMAAVKRGEEVVIGRAGQPEARLVPIDPAARQAAISAQRRAFCGSLRGRIGDIDWAEPTFTDEELDDLDRPLF